MPTLAYTIPVYCIYEVNRTSFCPRDYEHYGTPIATFWEEADAKELILTIPDKDELVHGKPHYCIYKKYVIYSASDKKWYGYSHTAKAEEHIKGTPPGMPE